MNPRQGDTRTAKCAQCSAEFTAKYWRNKGWTRCCTKACAMLATFKAVKTKCGDCSESLTVKRLVPGGNYCKPCQCKRKRDNQKRAALPTVLRPAQPANDAAFVNYLRGAA